MQLLCHFGGCNKFHDNVRLINLILTLALICMIVVFIYQCKSLRMGRESTKTTKLMVFQCKSLRKLIHFVHCASILCCFLKKKKELTLGLLFFFIMALIFFYLLAFQSPWLSFPINFTYFAFLSPTHYLGLFSSK
jgi:hypothetical protein